MALNQEDIDVGAAPNDGQGDPIRTAFIKCNDNFTQLYSLPNPLPPTTLIGADGDIPGMYAYDDTYFYYCYEAYNGVSTIWGQLVQSDEAIPSIGNGLSNVVIAFANANVTVGVNGTSNVGVFSPAGLAVRGAVTSNTIATGSLVSGNFTVAGDTISSVGETITITPSGNVVLGTVVVNADFNILGNRTTTNSKIIVVANTAANAAAANLSGIQVGQANYSSFLYNSSANNWSTGSNISAHGYQATGGNITGAVNITATSTMFAPTITSNDFYSNTATIGVVTANTLSGEGSLISNITGANVTGTVANATYSLFSGNAVYSANANYSLFGNASVYSTYANVANTVNDSAQPNITSVGSLLSLTVLGNSSSNNISVTNLVTAPAIGSMPGTILQGTLGVLSNNQPNIVQVGALEFLTVTGNIVANEDLFLTGNLYAGNIIANIAGSVALASFVTQPNQSNITGVGVLNNLNIANTGTINGANLIITNVLAANSIGRSIASPLGVSVLQGQIGAASNAQPNVTSVGNLISLNVNGQARFGTSPANTMSISGNTISTGGAGTLLNLGYDVVIPGNLQVQGTTVTIDSTIVTINDLFINVANNASTSSLANGGGIGVGPVGSEYASLRFNNATTAWNTNIPLSVAGNVTATYFNGIATSAQYADLAENYLADAEYAPGTVLSFGGDKEVTVSAQDLDQLIAGVVSTNPAYTMNSMLTGDFATPVALLGRVPCRVTGAVTRGAMMVSAGDGTARAESNPVMGSVIGKALESFDGDVGVIEIVVGKL